MKNLIVLSSILAFASACTSGKNTSTTAAAESSSADQAYCLRQESADYPRKVWAAEVSRNQLFSLTVCNEYLVTLEDGKEIYKQIDTGNKDLGMSDLKCVYADGTMHLENKSLSAKDSGTFVAADGTQSNVVCADGPLTPAPR